MKRMVLAAAALCFACGCSTTTRYVTASMWRSAGEGAGAKRALYTAYWEGECGGIRSLGAAFGGARCAKGDGKIKRCDMQPDNTLKCVDETAANAALHTDD